VAASLRKEPGLEVQVIDGAKGEFTVSVDGREVVRKGDTLPSVEEVLAAVRNAGKAKAAG
jgi:hypothetical protein